MTLIIMNRIYYIHQTVLFCFLLLNNRNKQRSMLIVIYIYYDLLRQNRAHKLSLSLALFYLQEKKLIDT